MFLSLTILLENNTAREMPFNVAHIVTVEPDLEDEECSYLYTSDGNYWYVLLSAEQVEEKLRKFTGTGNYRKN
jgi:hypothetical protein